MSKNEELDRGTSSKTNSKSSTRKTMNIPNSGLHYQVAISGRKGCNTGCV